MPSHTSTRCREPASDCDRRPLRLPDAGAYPTLAKVAEGRPYEQVAVEFIASRPTTRRGLSRVVLNPGVINDDAEEFFAWGYCWLLAAALHEASGWPYGLVERQRESSWEWTHAGVITPGDRFLDIRGCHDRGGLSALLTVAYGVPARVRAGSFADLCQAMGLAAGTAPDWWLGLLADPILTDTVRYFAARLLQACLPTPPAAPDRTVHVTSAATRCRAAWAPALTALKGAPHEHD
ncbi:hypothetical protein [Nonomuraea typhae]|uniref:hypothetical protein n=1 Tax=Nonomuraea typhae TaxID=2603600 RepID=UPI0012F73D95|nr:hypothetical protein [Nonomuraea typhae]